MRISATIETISSIAAGIITSAILIMMLACSPQAMQTQEPQWPPVVSFEHASIAGELEVDTPAGPVLIELSTGMVSGEGSAAVKRADLSAEVEFSINGARQFVHLASKGLPVDDEWAQCLTATTRSEIVAGLGVDVTARPPGLHASCGPAMLDVRTPLGNWSLPQKVAADPGGAASTGGPSCESLPQSSTGSENQPGIESATSDEVPQE
jgi:hypothetical protein